MATKTNEATTLVIMNAVSRGEAVTVLESRAPGLYGIGGPGRGGQISIIRHESRGIETRLDVRADGSFEVYPIGVGRRAFGEHRAFWREILAA